MKLRAAGRAQILTYESGPFSRIASAAGQLIKTKSIGLGLADTWPYHLSGRSPRPRSERVSFSLDSINLMKTRGGECSVKSGSFFDIGNNLRIDSDFCFLGTSRPPEDTKEANLLILFLFVSVLIRYSLLIYTLNKY